MKTKVIFRKWQNGDIIALFPEDPSDVHGRYCNSYMHVGQHGGADYGLINTTKPATPTEYKDLARELRQIGYKLDIRKRATYAMHEKRREAARV